MKIQVGNPANKNIVTFNANEVNAFYNQQTNSIMIPAGILEEPFYYSKQSKEGNFNKWWTQEEYDKFDEKSKKLAEQYSKYEIAKDVLVNGTLSNIDEFYSIYNLEIFDKMYKEPSQRIIIW